VSESGEIGAEERAAFDADGFVRKSSYVYLVVAAALAAGGVLLLLDGNVLGMALESAGMITAAAGMQRRPKKRRAARITLAKGAVRANGDVLAELQDVVGVSVVAEGDRHVLSLATRARGRVELELGTDAQAAELRAALGLALARSASYSVEAHAAFGCLTSLLVAGLSLYSVIRLGMVLSSKTVVFLGIGAPFLLAAVPVLFARLRTVTLTCGAEGLYVRGLVGRLVRRGWHVPWLQLEVLSDPTPTVIALRHGARLRRFELGTAAQVARLREEIRSRAAAAVREGDGDGDVGAVLARGERRADEWLASVRDRARGATEGYRVAALPEERLWSVVEDPAADPNARVAAALALRTQAVRGPRVADVMQRIRVAAGATALPEVRDAFSELADEPDDDRALAKAARVVR